MKVLWIQCPKTAGTSITMAMSETQGGVQAKHKLKDMASFSVEKAPLFFSFKHTTPDYLVDKGILSYDDIGDVLVVSSIRNPWDRLVSGWASGHKKCKTFKQFVKQVVSGSLIPYVCGKTAKGSWAHSQTLWYHVNNEYIINYLIRFEHLKDDWKKLQELLGIKRQVRLKITNVSEHKPYQEYYSPALRDSVGEFYYGDVILGGYSF